jgi:hypothetical protein
MEEVNLRYVISTYVNITRYSPVQLIYNNNNNKIMLGEISSILQ